MMLAYTCKRSAIDQSFEGRREGEGEERKKSKNQRTQTVIQDTTIKKRRRQLREVTEQEGNRGN